MSLNLEQERKWKQLIRLVAGRGSQEEKAAYAKAQRNTTTGPVWSIEGGAV